MARTKAVLGTGARLADHLSASLLARVFPAEVINEVLDTHGRNSQRVRSFPAVVGVYYCMALSLYPEAAYEEVFAAMSQGLAWAARSAQPARISKASISVARSKLGAAPLQALVQRCCMPMAEERFHPDAFYRGLRLMAMDGSNFELPDEPDNVAYFGRPGSRTGVAGYPQAQCAVLVECVTHAILAANLGPYRAAEWEVCKPLLASLKPGMLCMPTGAFGATPIGNWPARPGLNCSGAAPTTRCCHGTRNCPTAHSSASSSPPRANARSAKNKPSLCA
jgi:hypothetical protein